jgi:hypothetical protein
MIPTLVVSGKASVELRLSPRRGTTLSTSETFYFARKRVYFLTSLSLHAFIFASSPMAWMEDEVRQGARSYTFIDFGGKPPVYLGHVRIK